MEWIDELEGEAWNTIIDELVWHIRNGRIPAVLACTHTPESGVEFRFARTPTVFLPVEAAALAERWQHATNTIGRFGPLDVVRFRS